jgi:hypothetical protein
MCLSCGCMDPDDSHGNPYNITIQSVWDAANAGGVDTAEQVVNNIENTYALKVDDHFNDIDISETPDPDQDNGDNNV